MEDEAFYVIEGMFSFPYGVKRQRPIPDSSYMSQEVSLILTRILAALLGNCW
jgi:hypothetical protein